MSSLVHAIGGIFQPLLKAVADLLAVLYAAIPNYPIDIVILTVIIMALLTPLTVKSTKNMAAMQALGPEMKKLQQKYKGAENRVLLNEEMMKLYKEHQVNPASGCLPMLLQMPAFLVLYDVVRGITNTVTIPAKHYTTAAGLKIYQPAQTIAQPRYIGKNTKMYHDIVASHGQLNAFGMNFSDKLLSHHSSLFVALPFLLLVVASVGLQYLQMSRLNARNPNANAANPQAAMMQKYMPLIFGLIYLNVPAIINVYFITSSAIRIGTQEVLFRKGMVAGPGRAAPGGAKDRSSGPGPKSTTQGSGGKATGQKGSSEKEIPRGRPSSRSQGAVKGPAAGGRNGSSRVERSATPSEKGTVARNGSGGAVKDADEATGAVPGGSRPAPGRVAKSTNGAGGTNKSTNGSGETKGNGSRSTSSERAAEQEAQSTVGPKAHPRSKAKRERKDR